MLNEIKQIIKMAPLKRILKNLLKIVFGMLFIFYGVFFIYVERITVNRIQAAKAWPKTLGKIEELKYFRDNSYKIEYSYVVDGHNYTNDKIVPMFAWFSAIYWKDGGLDCTLIDSEGKGHFPRYVQGENITVFYNPVDPHDAMLLPFAPAMLPYRYFGIFFLLFLVLSATIGVRKLKFKKSNKNI